MVFERTGEMEAVIPRSCDLYGETHPFRLRFRRMSSVDEWECIRILNT